jgi:hypothetical protein
MMRPVSLSVAILLLLGGCDRGGSVEGKEAAPAAHANQSAPEQGPKALKSETVEAVFTGWDKGDYVWARMKVKGRDEFGAWSGPSPIDHFLDAHIGKPLTFTIETIPADVPEAGGTIEVQRIAAARIGSLTAAAWWQSLSPKQRQDAQISLAGALEPVPPPIEQ